MSERRNFTAEEKVSILRRHFLEKVAVSDLCDQFNLNPNVFYRWQKEFFEGGVRAFERVDTKEVKHLKHRLGQLEEKLTRKNEVVAELLEENVKLKKKPGGI